MQKTGKKKRAKERKETLKRRERNHLRVEWKKLNSCKPKTRMVATRGCGWGDVGQRR